MRFLGIDLGWHGKPSGLGSLDWDGSVLRFLVMERRTEFADILSWIDEQSRNEPALIAVDAPTIIKNETGQRVAERLISQAFGRYHAGCHSSNVKRPFAERTVGFGIALEQRGYMHADRIVPLESGRFQIEVHPHAAMIGLFGVRRIIKYKKGRIADRRRELARYRDFMMTVFPSLDPPLIAVPLPPVPKTGPALKAIEDQMDAVLCAYIGAHWWYWGTARNLVCGSREDGYIVVPAAPLKLIFA